MKQAELNYTSTGIKFFKYLDRLKDFQDCKPTKPITLHIMPEGRCNLNWSFCSKIILSLGREDTKLDRNFAGTTDLPGFTILANTHILIAVSKLVELRFKKLSSVLINTLIVLGIIVLCGMAVMLARFF
jgi:hypothetical protein